MWIFLNIGAGIIIFVMLPAIVFYNAESGWTYVDSVYFAFVSLSTIGFGDLINGGGEVENRLGNWMWAYRVFTILWLVSGLSFISSVNTLILDTIRKMPNCIGWRSVISRMKRMKMGHLIFKRGREERRQRRRENRKRVRDERGRHMEDRERNKEDNERNKEDRERNRQVAEQHRDDIEKQRKQIVVRNNIKNVKVTMIRDDEGKIEREGVRIGREDVRIKREGARIQREGARIEREGARYRKRWNERGSDSGSSEV